MISGEISRQMVPSRASGEIREKHVGFGSECVNSE